MKKPGAMTREILRHGFKKPATNLYPFAPSITPKGFRGKMMFDPEKCIGCKLCMKDCPADAIEIIKVGEKKFEAKFDLTKCIFCGQCVDSCNKDALSISTTFELAQLDPKKLTVTFHASDKENPEDKA